MQLGNSRFLLAFALTVAALAASVVAVNIVIDPFGYWDLVSIPGVNAQHPEMASLARMAKAQIVCRRQPSSVIMGTSRAEVGLDPRHPGWREFPGDVYNLALAGSGLKEMDLTLRHAVYASPRLRHVVMGLDFLMFNANREAVVFGTEVLDFDAKRLLTSEDDSCRHTFLYDADTLLWLQGLPYAFATVREQLPEAELDDPAKAHVIKWLALYDDDGFRGNNFDVLGKLAERDGYRSLFDTATGRFAGEEAYYVTKVWRPAPEERYCFAHSGQPDTMAVFRDILDFARKSGIDIRFEINPIHARLLIALQEAGLWPQYEDWKRALVSELDAEGKRSHAPSFPLWDFFGFNSITTEAVPPLGVTNPLMRWWWEPSHYQKAAGDLILDRVLGYRPDQDRVPPDFGILLTPTNIETWLEATLAAGRDYRRKRPEEVAIVTQRILPLIADSEGSNCGYDVEALRQGSEALAAGDRAAADRDFARAAAIHEADKRRAEALGVPYRENGFAALQRLALAGRELPVKLASWEAYQSRGNERAGKGDLAGAIDDYTAAIRLGPPNTALYFLRGTTRMRNRDYDGAARDFDAGLRLDPTNPTLQQLREQALAAITGTVEARLPNAAAAAELERRADAERAAGDLGGAIRDYSEAIRVGPPSIALYYLRGRALLEDGNRVAAAKDFEEGLELDPSNPTLRHLLDEARAAPARG